MKFSYLRNKNHKSSASKCPYSESNAEHQHPVEEPSLSEWNHAATDIGNDNDKKSEAKAIAPG